MCVYVCRVKRKEGRCVCVCVSLLGVYRIFSYRSPPQIKAGLEYTPGVGQALKQIMAVPRIDAGSICGHGWLMYAQHTYM